MMTSETLTALLSLVGIIIGIIPTYLFMRQKSLAEIEKLKAETEKTKAESEKIRKETPRLVEVTNKDNNGVVNNDGNLFLTFNDKESFDLQFINALDRIIDFRLHRPLESTDEANEIVRIGTALSRPLWVSGHYITRVKLGTLVEESAALLGHKEEQMMSLIDDLGWTNYKVGNVEASIKHIKHGIDIASEINNLAFISKGSRHLGAIYRQTGQLQLAKEYYEKSLKTASVIENMNDRIEATAQVHYALAFLYADDKDFESAHKHLNEASKMFAELGDKERLIKTISRHGDLSLEQRNFEEAKDLYRRGLKLARDDKRRDQIVRCLIGLAKVYLHEKADYNAKKCLEESLSLATSMQLQKEIQQIRDLQAKLPSKVLIDK